MRNGLLAVTLLASFSLSATTYYISPSGNDGNSGTSQGQAWQTIDRLNQIAFSYQPGDNILFEKGGVYRGMITFGSTGTASDQVTFGAYGSGDAPVISGSSVLGNWTSYQGDIWKTSLAETPEHLYVNGQLMQIARYPNTGWLRNDQGSNSSIQDADLTQPNGYWTGGSVVVRSSNWSYDAVEITSHSNGQINFPNIISNLSASDWGYFLRGKLSELDMAGEWYYDDNTNELYLHAPGNGNPNNMLIEASSEEIGIDVHLSRQYLVIEDLHFKHQTLAGVKLTDSDHITIQDCRFSDLYHGIKSYGHHNLVQNNIVERTYETGLYFIDNNTSVLNNELDGVAMEPGLGQNGWGYFGILSNGDNNMIRGNRLHTIGYIGISVYGNATIEKNYVDNALALLNDGCAIGFDNCDGVLVRENVIVNVRGNLESVAPNSVNYHEYAFGFYYGNISVRNTILEDNTVANCSGAGVHVDHTMESQGNIIRNNTFYDNAMQMSISDFSNNQGPGAQAPYYVADYGTDYSGNILYSTNPDQLSMRHLQVWTGAWSDWGNFSNNYYFNPYEKRNIAVFDVFNSTYDLFTVERWQDDHNEDAGSLPSDKNWPTHAVTNQYGGDLVAHGDFDNGVSDWSRWPSQSQLTHDYTMFSDGALKVNFTSNVQYPELFVTHDPDIALQNGQWYKLEFSLMSNQHGELHVGFQATSQIGTPELVYGKDVSFDQQRRDYVFFFQSDRDENGKIRFTNLFEAPLYWIDDVSLTKVDVVPVDPNDNHRFFYNDQFTTQTFNLTGCWSEVDGTTHTNSIDVPPFRSVVLVREDPIVCNLSTGVEQQDAAVTEEWHVFPNPIGKGELLNIGTEHDRGSFQILDLQGKLVVEEEVIKGQQHVRLSDQLSTGMYIARLQRLDGGTNLARITVQ